jgi:hypothetical protein
MNSLIRAPAQPAPLSSHNTYTTWPGGVDPTAPVFNTDNQKGGRRQRSSRRSMKHKSMKRRRSMKRSSMKRKNTRRNHRK